MNNKGDTTTIHDKVTISLFELASKYPNVRTVERFV